MDGIASFLNTIFDIMFGYVGGIAESAMVSFTGNNYTDIWNFCVSAANNVIEPIAVMIVLTFFLLGMLEKASSEQLTLEHVLRDVIKFCLGLYLVTNSVEIVVGCIELGNGILNSIGELNLGAATQGHIFSEQILEKNGFFAGILLALVAIIFMFINMIILVIMKCVCIIRILEIAIRTSMSPLALADTFAGPLLNSHAINFIRSFAALAIQGAFIMIIAETVPLLWKGALDAGALSDFTSILGFFLEALVFSIAALILMFKSGSIAKEMLGARG